MVPVSVESGPGVQLQHFIRAEHPRRGTAEENFKKEGRSGPDDLEDQRRVTNCDSTGINDLGNLQGTNIPSRKDKLYP
jgi:hypothetical protein